jgi:hypothetical protein
VPALVPTTSSSIPDSGGREHIMERPGRIHMDDQTSPLRRQCHGHLTSRAIWTRGGLEEEANAVAVPDKGDQSREGLIPRCPHNLLKRTGKSNQRGPKRSMSLPTPLTAPGLPRCGGCFDPMQRPKAKATAQAAPRGHRVRDRARLRLLFCCVRIY